MNIRRVKVLWMVVCLVSLLVVMARASANGASPPSDLLERADSLYEQRADLACVATGVNLLETYAVPGEYGVLWRLARGYYWLGHKATGKDRLFYFEKGEATAERATVANKSGPDGFYWYAVCMAEGAREKGIVRVVVSAKPLKAALDRVLAADPSFSDAHAYLARLYTKAPGWPLSIGDTSKAVYHAQEALKSGGESIRVRRIAAEAYLKAKDVKAARAELEFIVKASVSFEEPDDDRLHKEWAEKELSKLR